MLILVIYFYDRSKESIKSHEKEFVKIQKLANYYKKNISKDKCLIIIQSCLGCSECTDTIDQLAKKNINKDKVLIVLCYRSEKNLMIRLGDINKKASNIIIDRDKLSYSLRIIDVDHKFILIEDKEIKKIAIINSGNINTQMNWFKRMLY